MPRRFQPVIEVPDSGSRWITQTATDAQKMLLMARLYRGHLERIREAVTHDYPEWDDQRRRIEVASRISDGDPDVIAAARSSG